MQNIKQLLEQIAVLSRGDLNLVKKEVSQASVGWHLEHCLLIVKSSLTELQLTDPNSFQSRFSFKKWVVFTFERIPRGKVKSPKAFFPEFTPTADSIERLIREIQQQLPSIAELSDRSYIRHPFIGNLDKKDALKLLKIHTQHHLKIIYSMIS